TGGEPLLLLTRRRSTRPRRVVLLIDISGSMSPYADALLRLAHVVVRGHPRHTEAFSVGTRLTRLTPQMRVRDPGAALTAVAEAIPDWSGGTRLGGELKEFLDLYGRRGAARGALAIIASDGWERGDAAQLGTQMARLARLAHRVVWVNPHKAQPGYAPLTAGMRAAWPHIDEFVSGHSLDALEQLATAVIGGRREGGEPCA
ncbi:VWA domain-containing protein, partial [Streptomonospora algeriensis]